MKKPKELVLCQNNNYGKLDFFLVVNDKVIYLFTTNFLSYNIYEKYKNGQMINQLFENTSMVRQQRIKERIIRMIRYVEKEEGILLFYKSMKLIRKDTNVKGYKVV